MALSIIEDKTKRGGNNGMDWSPRRVDCLPSNRGGTKEGGQEMVQVRHSILLAQSLGPITF